MRLLGQKEPLPFIVEECIFRRPKNLCLVFKVKTVTDFTELDKILPEPQPRIKEYADGKSEQHFDDEDYQKRMLAYKQYRAHWVILESLSATPELEWDTVKPGEPATWGNYVEELQQWLIQPEMMQILHAVHRTNALSDDMMKAARDDFLAGKIQVYRPTPISPEPENSIMLSGKPADDGESVPQA